MSCFIEIYENSSLTPQSEKLFLQLQEHVDREVEYQKHMMQIEGMLHILLASATLPSRQSTVTSRNSASTSMTPSAAAAANANMVYNVGWPSEGALQ